MILDVGFSRRFLTICFAAFLTMGLSACSDDEGTNGNNDLECQTRADCEEGERCNSNGQCTTEALSCDTDSECDFGDYCVDGECADASCGSDDECTDAVCVNDRCRAGCSTNDQCEDGQICDTVTRLCKTAGCTTGSCAAFQVCEPVDGGAPTCRYTGDCNNDAVCAAYAMQVDDGDDYVCSTAQQTCIPKPPCGNDSDCTANEICEPRPSDGKNVCRRGCRDNGDCGLGQICGDDFRCVQGCDVDDDCTGENEVCDDLVCVETCMSRSECTDLNPGYICSGNPRTCGGCTDTSQCPATQFCDFSQGGTTEEMENPSIGLCVDLPPTCPPDSYADNHAIDRAYTIPAVPFAPMDTDRPVFCAENTNGEWFEISAVAGDIIEVSMAYNGSGNLDLALLRPDGTPVIESAHPPSEDNGTERIRYGVSLDSTFLIQVRGAILAQNLEYDISVNVSPEVACTDDAYEPNNDRMNAATLPEGMDNQDLEVCGSDPDFYLLQVPANQVISVTVAAPAELGNIDLNLYDSTGAIVASSSTLQDVEFFEYQTDAAADYVLEVYAAGGVGNIIYDLEWTTRDNVCTDVYEVNDTCNDATVLGSGTYTDLAICSDPDYFAVDLLPLQTVTFRATYDPAVAAGDLDITLFGPNDCATFLASETRAPSMGGTAVTETITYQAPSGGRFNLLGSLFAGINVPYTLEIDIIDGPPCTDDANEPNEPLVISPADAAAGNDNVFGGQRICDDDSDIYTIDLAEGDVIEWQVKFDNAQGDLDAFLIGIDGTTVLSSGTSTTTDQETVTYTVGTGEAGTYTLRVEGKDPVRTGYFVLTYLNGVGPTDPDCPDDYENNDDIANAAVIAPGSYGLLVCGNTIADDDYFAIDLNPGEVLTVDVTHQNATGNIDIELTDESGATVALSTSTTADVETVTYTTAIQQRLTWRVYTVSGADNVPYTMDVAVGAAGPCVDDSFEDNDTAGQASAIEAPGLYPRQRKCDTDEDWYAMTLPAGRLFEAFARYDVDAADVLIEILDPSQSVVASSSETVDGASATVTPASTGTYYVRVFAAAPTRIDYDLLIYLDEDGDGDLEGPADRRCPDLYENNDNQNTPSPLPTGLTDSLLICWENGNSDQDHYSIFVPAGATVTIDVLFTHANGNINAKLYNGAAEVSDGASTDDNEQLTYTNSTTNGQTLRLWVFGAQLGFTQYYSVDVQLAFADDCSLIDDAVGAADQAAADSAGATASGSYQDLLLCESTTDWFRLPTGTTTVEASAVYDPILGNIDIEVVDNTGGVVASSTTSTSVDTVTASGLTGINYVRVVSGGGFFRNGYDLFIDANGDGGTTDLFCPDPYERNDDTTTAHPFNFGANPQIKDSIACGADEDWFAVSLLLNRNYKWDVFFNHDTNTADLAIEIRDSSGTLVPNTAVDTADNDEALIFTPTATGTYYLRVVNNAPTPGAVDYMMQFRQNIANLCPEDTYEPNDTVANELAAPELVDVPGVYALGSCLVGVTPENDYYSFDGPPAGGPMVVEVFYDDAINLSGSVFRETLAFGSSQTACVDDNGCTAVFGETCFRGQCGTVTIGSLPMTATPNRLRFLTTAQPNETFGMRLFNDASSGSDGYFVRITTP